MISRLHVLTGRGVWRASRRCLRPALRRPLPVAARRHASISVPEAVSVAPAHADVDTVGFVTDVEGHLPYFRKSIDASDAVSFNAAASRLELAPNAMFVFGGDTCDKGVGDTIITNMLVDLKQRHPDRVFLLLGNRDLNKMKLTSELHESDIKRPVDDIPGPYWVDARSPGYTTLRQFLAEKLNGDRDADVDARILNDAHTATTRLQYMYKHQMGCADTFELRRAAIAQRRGVPPSVVRDSDVTEDTLRSVAPGGAMFEYLRHAQLAVVIGDSVFIHGAITPDNMGFVPADVNHDLLKAGPPPGYELRDSADVQTWITRLNRYAKDGVAQWIAKPHFSSTRGRRGGDALFGYGYSKAMKGKTVLPTSYMGPDHHPVLPDAQVASYLNASGIRRTVSGHQPFGDSPQIMRLPAGALEVVVGDTSFSDTSGAADSPHPDTRGQAVSAIHIRQPFSKEGSQLDVQGTLADGARIAFTLPPVASAADGTQEVRTPADAIGRETTDGWWVKAALEDVDDGGEPVMVLGKGQGYDVQARREPLSRVARMLTDDA